MVLFGKEEAILMNEYDETITPVGEARSEFILNQAQSKVLLKLLESLKGVHFDLREIRELSHEHVNFLEVLQIRIGLEVVCV